MLGPLFLPSSLPSSTRSGAGKGVDEGLRGVLSLRSLSWSYKVRRSQTGFWLLDLWTFPRFLTTESSGPGFLTISNFEVDFDSLIFYRLCYWYFKFLYAR